MKKINKVKLIFITLCVCGAYIANAAQIVKSCNITPEIINSLSPPKAINTSNNLRRKPGGSFLAQGSPIIIAGIITDEVCMPITDAIVTIWHANVNGLYQLADYSETYEPVPIDKSKTDPNFMGIGQSYSDNLGQYHFLSIMPGAYGSMPPHINITVRHNDFNMLQTKMLFPAHPKNQALLSAHNVPAEVGKFLIARQSGPNNNGEILYIFHITLPGKNAYKKY